MSTTTTPPWLPYALLSGLCAALNGAFAKLTTTHLTTTWATAISQHILGLHTETASKFVEALVRGLFFLLNLLCNAVMWAFFTHALRLASSTVRVSVMNTSANFLVTAGLGWVVFGEELAGLWWIGAALLVAGSVIIGTRDDGEKVERLRKDFTTATTTTSTTATTTGGGGGGDEGMDLDRLIDTDDEEEPDAPMPSVGGRRYRRRESENEGVL